jgi:hypothetical protein
VDQDRRPETPSDSTDPADREAVAFIDAVGAVIQPFARLGFSTAHDIVKAVRSTRAAGRDLLRVVNPIDRYRALDAGPEAIDTWPTAGELVAAVKDDLQEPETAVEPVESSDAVGPGVLGGLRAVAQTALNPSTMLSAAVAPIRRVVSAPAGADLPIAVRGATDKNLRAYSDRLIAESHQPQDQPAQLHPAFALILPELTPDEVRILRFLAVAGAQPAIDIRTKTLFHIGSERIAGGINMIAEMAGCRWPGSDQEYLANLYRLGLVRFSAEPVDDYRRYALIEVQPRAIEAVAKAKATLSIYRSIYLSPFGRQFCEVCVDVTGYNAGGWGTDERGDKIIGRGPPDPAARKH